MAAYIKALDTEKLLRVCADISGDAEDTRAAIAAEFDVSDIAADAIPALQVRRFTPWAIEQMPCQLSNDNHLLPPPPGRPRPPASRSPNARIHQRSSTRHVVR